jgi:hypothetical protein
MSTNSPLEERSPRATQARTTPARRIGVGPQRYTTAGVVGVIAVLYLLIGADAITVVEDQAASDPAPVFIAGGLFVVLAVLLWVTTARVILVSGVLLQVVVLGMYVVVAGERTPRLRGLGTRDEGCPVRVSHRPAHHARPPISFGPGTARFARLICTTDRKPLVPQPPHVLQDTGVSARSLVRPTTRGSRGIVGLDQRGVGRVVNLGRTWQQRSPLSVGASVVRQRRTTATTTVQASVQRAAA